MNLLVTGGAGFIGSNLCSYFVSQGHNLIVVDDLSTGKISNLSTLLDHITLHVGKIEEYDFSDSSNINAVIHLAAQASVPLSVANFKESSSTNLLGSLQVIDYCSRKNIPLVYASSSAVYGGLVLGDDDSTTTDLLSPYATDKLAMEFYANTANKIYKLSSIGLRFYNVYGPMQDPTSPYSGVISLFVDKLTKGLPITIYGGYQTRDFVYVSDVVKCIDLALNLSREKTVCENMNVLTGKSFTIDLLADMIANQIGVEADKIYHELPVGDPEMSQGTIDKLSRILSVNPSEFTDLKNGLKNTVEFIKNN